LQARGAQLEAAQKLRLQAQGNLSIESATNSSSFASSIQTTDSGLLNSKSTTRSLQMSQSTQVGSSLSAGELDISSGKNINITASQLVSDKDLQIKAQGDVSVVAGLNTSSKETYYHEESSGLDVGNIGKGQVAYGDKSAAQKANMQGTTQSDARSVVGSLGGNVNIQSGGTYKQIGSDILSQQDTNVTAKRVEVLAGVDKQRMEESTETKQSGLTLSVSSSLVQAAEATVGDINKLDPANQKPSTRNSRTAALYALKTIADTGNALEKGDALMNADTPSEVAAAAGAKVSVSYGQSESKTHSISTASTHSGSTIGAGGKVNIKATDSSNGDIVLEGSDIKAQDVSLDAARRVEITSVADTSSNRSENSSSSTSLGVSIAATSKGAGLSVDGALARAKGHVNSDSATQQNSHITASNTLQIKSGSDTNIAGGRLPLKQ
jgi:filamentous hemagglutinin